MTYRHYYEMNIHHALGCFGSFKKDIYFSSLSKSVCVSMLAYDCMGMQMQLVIMKIFKTI